MIGLLVVLATFSLFALWLSVYALIQIEAFRRSTHQVTFLNPSEQIFQNMTDEVKSALQKAPEAYDNIM